MFDPISTANEQRLRRLAHVQLDDVSLFFIHQARGRSRCDRFQQHDGVAVDMVESFPRAGLRQAVRGREEEMRQQASDAAKTKHLGAPLPLFI